MNLLENKLEEIFREVFDDEKISINDEMDSNDVENWDSLNHVKLILACEEVFKIKFEVQEVDDLRKVKDLISLIKEKTSE
tara:strand:- start:244 stop:483 length:240 start_codon:yes stop_codon:yes gene_type:complete